MKKHLITILLVLVGLVGIGLIVYPTLADWWNSFHQSRAVASYAEAVINMNHEEYDRIIGEAAAYNERLALTDNNWIMDEERDREYWEQLNVNETGIMGYIAIPKINITLPVYHGTDEAVLQIAIGHLAGTSLPVGGESSHCVVSGHRGLPSARLFTDIDRLAVGDTWTINVLDRTYTYEVDRIRVVVPTDLSALQIEPGQDYCTLVTCTPYGINTHRLLVRGHRISNAQGDANVVADAILIDNKLTALSLAVPLLALLMLYQLAFPGKPGRR